MRCLILFLLLASGARADLRPLWLDGFTEDWLGYEGTVTDPAGDTAGHDLTALELANDGHFVVLRFRLAGELLQQENNSLVLYLDTDGDAQTGFSAEGLGSELVWFFGQRTGMVYQEGQSLAVQHRHLGLRILPSHSSSDFELAIAQDAAPMGTPLFDDSTVRAVLKFVETGGDRLPDTGAAEWALAGGSVPLPDLLPLGRERAEDLRLLAWNTLFGSLFTPANQDEYSRILQALHADVIAFQEIWDQSAAETAQVLDLLDPRDTPWQAAKLASGNVLASRFPIGAGWQIHPSYRNTAHLLHTGDALGTPLLVINVHLRCCGADDHRQVEADAIVAFLRQAREGLYPQIPAGTPFVLCGDFNLVGQQQQLRTLLTGDVQDESQYGPDSPPDWDGGPLTDLRSYHLGGREAWSWQEEASWFSPGRLDYMLYTDSILETGRHGLLWTPTLPADTLAAWGLEAQDTPTASDHLPRFVDLRPLGTTSIGRGTPPERPSGLVLEPPFPNPFNPRTTLGWSQDHAGPIELDAWSVGGRKVASLARGWHAAGRHELAFDGRDLASGLYLLSLSQHGHREVARMLVLK